MSGRRRRAAVRPQWEVAGWVGVGFGVLIQLTAFFELTDESLKVPAGVIGQIVIIASLVVTTVVLPRRDATRQLRRDAAANLAMRDGEYPTIQEVDAAESLGLHIAVEPISYAPRGSEDRIRTSLMNGRRVLISGPALSGKTRLAIEALSGDRDLVSAPLVIPRTPAAIEFLRYAPLPRRGVLFLPDLGAMLDALDLDDLRALSDRGLRIVATIRDLDIAQSIATPREAVIRSFVEHVTLTDTAADRASLARRIGDPEVAGRVEEWGLGAYIAGAGLAQRAFHTARIQRPWAYVLLHAAADWGRSGMSVPAPVETLRRMAEIRLRGLGGDTADTSAARKDAEDWVRMPLAEGLRLIDAPTDTTWRPHGSLLAALEPELYPSPVNGRIPQTIDERLPTATWDEIAVSDVPVGSLWAAAKRAAVEYPRGDATETLWKRLSLTGDPIAEYSLGATHYARENYPAAEASFRRISGSYPAALTALGVVLAKTGRPAEAEESFRAGIDAGDEQAPATFSLFLGRQGRDEDAARFRPPPPKEGAGDFLDAAKRAREAIDAGDPEARDPRQTAEFLAIEGRMLMEAHAFEASDAPLRHAAEYGLTDAMNALSSSLSFRGRLEEAEFWARRSASRESTAATLQVLGVSLELQGRLDEAERTYRDAAEQGSGPASENLGGLLAARGDLEAAEKAVDRALELGEESATFLKYKLLLKNDRVDEAKTYFERAVAARHPTALDFVCRGLSPENPGPIGFGNRSAPYLADLSAQRPSAT